MSLRETIKNLVPAGVRPKIRAMLEAPGIETQVLRPCTFEADPSAVPRLTFILPSLSAKEAFGGVTTGLQYFLAMAGAVRARTGADIRILTEEAYDPADSALPGQLKAAGVAADLVSVESLKTRSNSIATRAHEMFMAYNWWISLNIEPVLEAQAAHFKQGALPKLYIIQEYEPQFYPFSSAHVLALHAFNSKWPLWAVFNSSELASFYTAQGNVCAKSYVFEPRLAPQIKAFQSDIKAEEKTRTVLIYGRPTIKRNCFSILQGGLEHWANGPGRGQDWRIVSAGTKHADIDLGGGHKITSLGKLSLEGYGTLLREASIGISLMSSPHPSYPPLEMAHFGMRTITNRYPGKDLTNRHENIVSLPDMMPATLGDTLAEVMSGFDADPSKGLKAASHMPEYLSDIPFDCLDAMVGDLCTLLADRGVEVSA